MTKHRHKFSVQSAEGLTWEVIPGVPMNIPGFIHLERCDSCDEFSVTADESAAIDAALKHQADDWKAKEVSRLVNYMVKQDGVTVTQLEGAAGVPMGTLSNPSEYSLTLVRLLQAFACPKEMRRHLARIPTTHNRG